MWEEITLSWRKEKKNWAWGVAVLIAKAPCPAPGINGSLTAHTDPEFPKRSLERTTRPSDIINPSFFSSQHWHW